jgi:phosphate transport system substrate-binding protein
MFSASTRGSRKQRLINIMASNSIFARSRIVLAVLGSLVLGISFARETKAEERITIKGSNTFGEELAPALIERFRKDHPEVTFELESKGSGSGFEALLAGNCDIGASSRSPSEDEKRLARSRGIKMNDYLIGFYGVAVIVSDQNPVKALTDAQVRDVFTGMVSNWKDVGGEDVPIQLYIRDPVSGTHLGFREMAMGNKPYVNGAKALTRYTETVDAARQDRAAIDYTSMNLAEQRGVHAVTINKVQPTPTAVNEGNYPYSRTLRLYTAKNREPNAVKAFLRFVRSRAGQAILSEHGFVRVFEERLWSPDL